MGAERYCVHCNSVIKGRTDKKYCDDNCRSNHNYILSDADNARFIRNINSMLRKNRRILKTLNINGKTKVLKNSLTDRGFDFSYYTSIYETEKRGRYYFCYDMGYLLISDLEVLLVSKTDPPRTQARQ